MDDELEIKAYYAGHVLGAAMFQVKVGSQSFVYTVRDLETLKIQLLLQLLRSQTYLEHLTKINEFFGGNIDTTITTSFPPHDKPGCNLRLNGCFLQWDLFTRPKSDFFSKSVLLKGGGDNAASS